MASKYDPYSGVNAIYKLKNQWDNANDDTTKNNIAEKAKAYYEQLRKNGYNDVADQLTASNTTQAKAINDKWAKMGKTSTRDYLYTLGQSRGMSQSDIDKLISWDNQSGEVSFGGKKIGAPDSVVDGVSYWSDTSVLDNAFNDYISRTGNVRSKSTAVNQENENLFSKYNHTYDDLVTTNPFETDTAKAILAKYDLAGLQGRDNAVASGSASNGGNIDSYAAANALRQQASLVNQGQMMVLDAHQQKIDNVRGLLSDMGVNIDRVFDQDETSKLNNTAMLSEQANVTGYTPSEWVIANDDVYNTYLNPDGTFKKELENVDIQELINSAKASGDTDTANKLAVVRAKKILGNYGEFGQYSNQGDTAYMKPQITEARRESEQNDATVRETVKTESADTRYGIDAEKEIAKEMNKTEKEINAANNATDLSLNSADNATALTIAQLSGTQPYEPILTLSQAEEAIKKGEISQGVIDDYNYYHRTNYTVDNPPKVKDDNSSGYGLTDDTTASNDIYSKWESDGITFETFTIKGPVDANKLESSGVDDYGKKAIQSVYTAVANGELGTNGIVSNYDLANYLINQSDNNNTNKNQLKKVFAYFGLSKNMLDNVEDSGFWFWQWGQGTNYKN